MSRTCDSPQPLSLTPEDLRPRFERSVSASISASIGVNGNQRQDQGDHDTPPRGIREKSLVRFQWLHSQYFQWKSGLTGTFNTQNIFKNINLNVLTVGKEYHFFQLVINYSWF